MRKIADDVSEVVANTSIFSLHSNLHHEFQNTWCSKYFLQCNFTGLTFLFIVGITYLQKQFSEIHQYGDLCSMDYSRAIVLSFVVFMVSLKLN